LLSRQEPVGQAAGVTRDRDAGLDRGHPTCSVLRVALARHACRLTFRMLVTQEPFDEQRYRRNRHQVGR